MSLGTILLIILVLLLIGALPNWGYSRAWGRGPAGMVGPHSCRRLDPRAARSDFSGSRFVRAVALVLGRLSERYDAIGNVAVMLAARERS